MLKKLYHQKNGKLKKLLSLKTKKNLMMMKFLEQPKKIKRRLNRKNQKIRKTR
jgi:hypothetical protein